MNDNLLYAVIVIPIVLLISLATYTPFFSGTRSVFELTVTNESLGELTTNGTAFTTTYPVKDSSVTDIRVMNATWDDKYDSYSIDYNDYLGVATVTVYGSQNGTGVDVYIDYTGYNADYRDYAVRTYTQTQSGYALGGQLPFIYIAIALVGAILAGFGLKML